MEAKLSKVGEVTLLSLVGRLELEKAQKLKQICEASLAKDKLVFCMKELSFVGSSGIQYFFQFVREINKANPNGVKIAGLSPDFKRLLYYKSEELIEIHENVDGAVRSFEEEKTSKLLPT